ncbi:MAG: hypothetical protein Q7S43_04135 [bacterium]|nr:hypothetical protein [bacterium]
MFKNLSNIIEKKKKLLIKSQDLSQDINKEVRNFLINEFGRDLEGFSFTLNYQAKDGSLLITTDNKMLSNELAIRLGALNDFLRDKKISLNKILIR